MSSNGNSIFSDLTEVYRYMFSATSPLPERRRQAASLYSRESFAVWDAIVSSQPMENDRPRLRPEAFHFLYVTVHQMIAAPGALLNWDRNGNPDGFVGEIMDEDEVHALPAFVVKDIELILNTAAETTIGDISVRDLLEVITDCYDDLLSTGLWNWRRRETQSNR